MSLETPTPNQEQLQSEQETQDEEKPSNIEEQEQPTEESEEEKSRSGKSSSEKEKAFTPKNRTSVTMYGIIAGDQKCEICQSAHKFFTNPQNFKHFTYKHVSLTTPKGMKVAEKRGMTQMPFFRIRRKGDTTDEWLEGYNEQEFIDMTK